MELRERHHRPGIRVDRGHHVPGAGAVGGEALQTGKERLVLRVQRLPEQHGNRQGIARPAALDDARRHESRYRLGRLGRELVMRHSYGWRRWPWTITGIAGALVLIGCGAHSGLVENFNPNVPVSR